MAPATGRSPRALHLLLLRGGARIQKVRDRRIEPAANPALILALVVVLLLVPSLLLGTMMSHSSPQNLTWAAQFSEQFRDVILYPRWMPDSFEGLGGPAF